MHIKLTILCIYYFVIYNRYRLHVMYYYCLLGATYNLSEQEKAEADARSVYVGNVCKSFTTMCFDSFDINFNSNHR